MDVKIVIVGFLSMVVFVGCSNELHDFDVVCNAFVELSKESNLGQISSEDRNTFIDSRVDVLRDKSNAKIVWNNLQGLYPLVERYNVFVESAESVGLKNWRCEEMEALYPTIDLSDSLLYLEPSPEELRALGVTSMKDATF